MPLKLYLTRNEISKKLTHQRLKNRVPFLQTQEEKILSTYSQQKKVSRLLCIDEPVKDVPSIPYNIDRATAFKRKAKNRLELLDALKEERKWKKVSQQNGQGSCLLDMEIVRDVIHAPTPIATFINNLSMATVQTSKMMEPVSIAVLWRTTHHV